MNPLTKYTLDNIDFTNVNECIIEKSRDNKNIVRIIKDNKCIYLGSKYSVNRDIDNFNKELRDINEETIIIIFGLGAGEHIVELLKNTKYNTILVVEPNISIIKTFFKLEISKKVLENDRFMLYLYKQNEIKDILNSIINKIDANNVKVVSYANYDKVYKEEFDDLLKKCIEVIKKSIFNINTEIFFSKKVMQVYLDNIKNIINSKPVNLYKNLCRGMPAVVVSAGPSLSKNIHKLKESQNKFIIICGARTLKPLLDVGVTPDFVCIIDPGDISFDFIKNCSNYNAEMLYCNVSNFKTVNAYKGEKIIFRENAFFNHLTDKILGYDLDTLWQGGSVAHVCTSFANYIGCNKIIFIGQDFAYTNNKYHDDTADFSDENSKDINKKGTIYVDDIYGNKVITSKVLNFYRINLEEYILKFNNIDFINATEGGANIKGTKIATLQEVIDSSSKILDKSVLDLKINKDNIFDKEKIIINLKSIIKDLNKVKDRSKKILDDVKTIKKKEIKINKRTLKTLKRIKSNNNNIQKLDILNSLINPVLDKIITRPEYRENNMDSELQKVKKLFDQTEPIYNAVIDASGEIVSMVNKLIGELEGEKNE